MQGSGPFQNGATSGTTYANFDQSYDAINGQNYQSTSSLYTVQAGDTLQSIAYRLWGDSSFWYLIADANGMTSDQTLVAGQDLVIPDKVHNVHNNASTFQVYDPNKAQGAHLPTPPKPQPQGDGGCGVFGTILLVVIAIVVTVVTAGAAIAALAPASAGITGIGSALGAVAAGTTGLSGLGLAAIGAAAGALGSIVSQGVGLATGLQKSFNWGAVAGSAIGGALSFGLGPTGLVGDVTGNALVDIGINAAAANALTQGVELATGLQKKFDWAGVAAAGVGAAVGAEASSELNGVDFGLGDDLNAVTGNLATGMSRAIANAATRSVINGTDFGDNIIAALPDVIGQTLGNLVAGKVVGWLDSSTQTFTLGDGTVISYTPSPVPPVPLTEGAEPPSDLTSLLDMTPPTLNFSSIDALVAATSGALSSAELTDAEGIAQGIHKQMGLSSFGTSIDNTILAQNMPVPEEDIREEPFGTRGIEPEEDVSGREAATRRAFIAGPGRDSPNRILVIGRGQDLSDANLGPNEVRLAWPSTGGISQAEADMNHWLLNSWMDTRAPIRDASPEDYLGYYTNLERGWLKEAGWTSMRYSNGSVYWLPPGLETPHGQ